MKSNKMQTVHTVSLFWQSVRSDKQIFSAEISASSLTSHESQIWSENISCTTRSLNSFSCISVSLTFSQTPVYTARQGTSASFGVAVHVPHIASTVVPTHGGMARLSSPGWLVTHWDGLPSADSYPSRY